MDVLLLALTVAPGFAIALFIYLKDKFDPEPLHQLTWAFVAGIACAFVSMGIHFGFLYIGIEDGRKEVETFLYAYITVAFSEEFAKFLFLKRFYRREFFDEPFDGITYAVMIAMGFASLENLLYVFFTSNGGFSTALLRMLTAVPAHASFAVIMGYFVGLAKFSPGRGALYQALGLLAAVFFHGTYDFLLMLKNYPYIAIGAIVSLIVAIILSFRAIRLHQKNSPFKNRDVII